MLDLLETLFIVLLPVLFVAIVVNQIMFRVRLRRLKRMLAGQGRCLRCLAPLEAGGKCPACDAAGP